MTNIACVVSGCRAYRSNAVTVFNVWGCKRDKSRMRYFYDDCNIRCKIKVVKVVEYECVSYKIDLIVWCKVTKKKFKKKFYI